MTISQLKCFVSVESHLSFTKAAEDCHIVQATVSRQISALEEELGVKLFDRDSHGVRPTPAGVTLAQYAPVFLEYQNTIISRVRNASANYEKSLRIGVGPYEHLFLGEPLRTMHTLFPGTSVELTSYTYYVLMTRYRNQVLDLALCNEPCAAQMTSYTPVELCTARWLVVAAEGSDLWAGGDVAQLLSHRTIITLVNDQYDAVRRYCFDHFEQPFFFETNFLSTMLEMVKANLGIAILPDFAAGSLPAGVRAGDLLPESFTQKFYAMISPRTDHDEARVLVELCREKLGGVPSATGK